MPPRSLSPRAGSRWPVLRPASVSLLLAVSALTAAGAPAQPASPRVTDLPRDLIADLAALPSRENGLWLLGGAALTITVYQIEDAEGAARALDRRIWDTLSDAGSFWGDARLQLPLALGAWGVGAWTDNPRAAGTGYAMTRGLLITYATVSSLQVVIDRERPNGERYSFPTAHTAAAFSTAGVLTRRYGGWIGAASLLLAGFTAMGRMEDLKHWASDVAAGATIGWVVGRTASRDEPGEPRAWRLVPTPTGMTAVRRF
jgi:membrane-associated phospholipid phosphatase